MSFRDEWLKRFKERRGFFFPELDDLIEDMEREMAEAFGDMENCIPRYLVRVKQLPDGSVKREYGPFVYGYSVKIGPDGKPSVREFGNIKPGRGGEERPTFNLQDQREPFVDVIDENDQVKVVAELPGVEKEDIQLLVSSRSLTINVDAGGRRYHKELTFPFEVEESSARSRYSNGVLETVLRKRPKDTGTKIEVS